MSDNEPNLGPDRETLRHLKHMLPGLAANKLAGKIKYKGKPVMQTRPRKVCKVCCALFDIAAVGTDSPLEPAICGDCQNYLDSGMIALVSGDEYAFARLSDGNTKDDDLKGQIIHMQPDRWQFVKQQLGIVIQQRKGEDENGK